MTHADLDALAQHYQHVRAFERLRVLVDAMPELLVLAREGLQAREKRKSDAKEQQ